MAAPNGRGGWDLTDADVAAILDAMGPDGEVHVDLPPDPRVSLYAEVTAERGRAHTKHGAKSAEDLPVDDPTGILRAILMEDVGEVAEEWVEAFCEDRPVDMARVRAELIQVASVALAWADRIRP